MSAPLADDQPAVDALRPLRERTVTPYARAWGVV